MVVDNVTIVVLTEVIQNCVGQHGDVRGCYAAVSYAGEQLGSG